MSVYTNPGDLTHYVEFQTRSEADDGILGNTQSFATEFSAWVAIWPLNARELLEAGKLEHNITHRVRMWYDSRVVPDMRIKHGDRYLDIISVINAQEADIRHDLLAREVKD